VLAQIIAPLRVDDFAGTLACHSADHGTNRGAGSHTDRTCDCADRGTGECPSAGACAFGQVVVFTTIGRFGIDRFCCALSG
jgi:hypothetical protein